MAGKGNRIVVNAQRVGGASRTGEIIEVIEGDLRIQYRVRWSDGHESLFAPAAGTARIEPAQGGQATQSGSKTRRSPVKAPSVKRIGAPKVTAKKTGEKTTAAKRSTAKKTHAKKSMTKKTTVKRGPVSPSNGMQRAGR